MILTKMSEVHKFSLEMLNSFDKLCKKNNIKYCLAYGALIGYSRHNNLIPWDDDIDVLMFRKDYEKLVSLPKDAIDADYELVCPDKNDVFFDFITRYSNNQYSAERIDFVGKNNESIYENLGIDIFIIDNTYSGFKQKIRVKKMLFEYLRAIKYRNITIKKSNAKIKHILSCMAGGRNLSNIVKKYDGLSSECKSMSDMIFISNAIPTELSFTFPKKWFENTVEIELRGNRYPAPCGYMEFIAALYPDFPNFPPEGNRKPQHFKVILDEQYN